MLSTCRRLPGTDDSRARFRSEPPVNKSPEFAYGPSTVLFRRISLTVRNRKPPRVATCVVSIGERHLSRGGLAPDEGDHSLPKRFHEGRRVVLDVDCYLFLLRTCLWRGQEARASLRRRGRNSER